MNSPYPLRTRFGRDIVAEVLLPEKQSGKVAILCSGVPSMPYHKTRLQFFANRGYVVIAPRYRGTWESNGYFLDESPSQDIRIIIESLAHQPSIQDLSSKKIIRMRVSNIHLFGASFGGPAVLLNTQHPLVKKVVTLSPVLNWKREEEDQGESFDTFLQLTQMAFGMAYRVKQKPDWNKLIKTGFYSPVAHIDAIIGKKVFILHALDDTIVSPEPVKEFAKKTGSQYYLKPRGGHDISMTHQFIWKKIEKFLNTK